MDWFKFIDITFYWPSCSMGFSLFQKKIVHIPRYNVKKCQKKVKRKNLNIVVLSSSWDTLFVSLTRNKFSMYPTLPLCHFWNLLHYFCLFVWSHWCRPKNWVLLFFLNKLLLTIILQDIDMRNLTKTYKQQFIHCASYIDLSILTDFSPKPSRWVWGEWGWSAWCRWGRCRQPGERRGSGLTHPGRIFSSAPAKFNSPLL